MRDLWQLLVSLMSNLDSGSGWAAIGAAAFLTLFLAAALVAFVCVSIAAWGCFMYVRRWLGWRALWRRRS
jgi:uncharacterized membrane protein